MDRCGGRQCHGRFCLARKSIDRASEPGAVEQESPTSATHGSGCKGCSWALTMRCSVHPQENLRAGREPRFDVLEKKQPLRGAPTGGDIPAFAVVAVKNRRDCHHAVKFAIDFERLERLHLLDAAINTIECRHLRVERGLRYRCRPAGARNAS